MSRDRLDAVVRVRQLVERRRIAEHAAAQRSLRAAEREREAAEQARLAADLLPSRAARANALVLHRLGAMAHADNVEQATEEEIRARRTATDTERRQVEAAVERASVERLTDRRAREAARDAERIEERRRDETALQTWRRRR